VTNGSPLQGDIFWVDFDEPDESEPGYSRPAVVIQNNARNRSNIGTVIVCTLTRNLNRESDPGNVLLEAGEAGLQQPCVVNVSQVFTVNKQDLRDKIGTLGYIRVRQIIDGMRLLLEPRDD
jgi:mRNA interferase MazF